MAIVPMRRHMDTRTRHIPTQWIEVKAGQYEAENEEKLNRNKNCVRSKISKQAPIYVASTVFCICFSKYDTKHCNICDMPPLSTLITSRKELTVADRCHQMPRRKMCQILQHVRAAIPIKIYARCFSTHQPSPFHHLVVSIAKENE